MGNNAARCSERTGGAPIDGSAVLCSPMHNAACHCCVDCLHDGTGLVVDFAGAGPRFAYVADTVGHSWDPQRAGKRAEVAQLWEATWSNDSWRDPCAVGLPSTTWSRVQDGLRARLLTLSAAFESLGVSSTLTAVWLLSCQSRPVLGLAHVGDSAVFLLQQRRGSALGWRCSKLSLDTVSSCELAGDVRNAQVQAVPCEEGDVVLLCTDGVLDVCEGVSPDQSVEHTLLAALQPLLPRSGQGGDGDGDGCDTDGATRLCQRVAEGVMSWSKETCASLAWNSSKKDDISVAVMQVPS